MGRRREVQQQAGYYQPPVQPAGAPVYYYPNQAPGMVNPAAYAAEAEQRAREYWELSRSRLRTLKIIGILLIAAVALTVLFALGVIRPARFGDGAVVTEFKLKDIGELATEAASLSIVQPVEVSRKVGVELPGSKSRYDLTFALVVKAGLDFDQVVLQVDGSKHEIKVKMPAIRILSPEAYLSARTGGENPFSQLTPEEIEEARKKVIEKAETVAYERGTLIAARENAEKLISGLLAGGYDLNDYKIAYEWP